MGMRPPATAVAVTSARRTGSTIPPHPGMTALYLERFMNYGITRAETSFRQADHRHRPERQRSVAVQPDSPVELAQARARRHPRSRRHSDGIPAHPIWRTAAVRPRRSTATSPTWASSRFCYGYPIDAVVLTTGCDKTTPAQVMAAATVNIPAIVLSGGPMLNGWMGELSGSGTIVWKSRERLAAGEIGYDEFMDIVASSAPSVGHCNTMGTASTRAHPARAPPRGTGRKARHRR